VLVLSGPATTGRQQAEDHERAEQAVIGDTEAPPPIVNPSTGFWVDPANATRECRVTLSAQLAALPAGGPYKGAVKLGTGAYGPLSTAFTLAAAQAHPCDGPFPTTATVVEGTRTIEWCHAGLDTNGNPTTVTSWRVYVDNALAATILPAAVTIGSTANAAGLRLHSSTLAVTRGSRAVQMSAVNAVGEAARSIVFTATVTAPAAPPSTLQIRDIR